MMLAFALTLAASGALADDVEDAHKLWNCLARKYSRPDTRGMSRQDFTDDFAGACPARTAVNFRVTLLDYLNLQFPNSEGDVNLATANHAIDLAQRDIVTAFIRRKATPN